MTNQRATRGITLSTGSLIRDGDNAEIGIPIVAPHIAIPMMKKIYRR